MIVRLKLNALEQKLTAMDEYTGAWKMGTTCHNFILGDIAEVIRKPVLVFRDVKTKQSGAKSKASRRPMLRIKDDDITSKPGDDA